MSPGSSTESYPALAHIGLRENPGKNLNQITCPNRESNPGHLVPRPDALTMGSRTSKISLVAIALELCPLKATRKELMTSGCVLNEFLEPGQTINAVCYIQTLLKHRLALCEKRSGKKIICNTLPLTARVTVEKIRTFRCHNPGDPRNYAVKLTGFLEFGKDATTLPPHGFDGNLSTLLNKGCDWLLTGEDRISVTEQLQSQHYEMLEDIQKAVPRCLREAGTDFCRKEFFKLTERCLSSEVTTHQQRLEEHHNGKDATAILAYEAM
ncbi:hypothetical protein ANN_07620 [Periplaneta americana]|uniref:Uncharacterized protein n=1 Tax=Periplaneta americana TaxID=6978 RepID=A0ABQ8SZ63_PERAM|nr:hypothetical protein ANN_07620 [Periplaneta americana]